MTLAPPPATIVQIRPLGFKTVNFREALVYKLQQLKADKHEVDIKNRATDTLQVQN